MREWTMVIDATVARFGVAEIDGRGWRVRREGVGSASPTAVPVLTPAAAPLPTATAAASDELSLLMSSEVRPGDDPPTTLIVVVPGDVDPAHVATLAERARRAGWPDPSWVPDAVARAGRVLASPSPGRPGLVVDVRGGGLEVWGVRTTAAAGKVGTVEPLPVRDAVGCLLLGMLRAKLSVLAPHLASTLDESGDLAARRALRTVLEQLGAADGWIDDDAEIVVTVADVEITLLSHELASATAHAAREAARSVLGAEAATAPAIVVADSGRGIAGHLVDALDAATVAGAPGVVPDAALYGAVALARGTTSAGAPSAARPWGTVPAPPAPANPVAGTRVSGLVEARGSGVFPETDIVEGSSALPVFPERSLLVRPPSPGPARPRDLAVARRPGSRPPGPRRPRWAVMALAGLIAVALVGSVGVLTGVAAPSVSPSVSPVSCRPAGPGIVPAPAIGSPAVAPAPSASPSPVAAVPRRAGGEP